MSPSRPHQPAADAGKSTPGFPAVAAGPNRTGGLVWHVRALRSAARWQPTRAAIARWLEGTRFASRRLVLVGASAGWMMSTPFLARFDLIEAIDIDPLSAPLFAWRHGVNLKRRGVQVNWHRVDALECLESLLARWPDAAWLFDNVLGQQIYRHRDLDAVEAALSALARRLAGREWGSVHDWLSGPADPPDPRAVLAAPQEPVAVSAGGFRMGPRELSAEAAGEWLLERLHAHGQWQDHRTAGVFPSGTEITLIPWEFRPGKWHWLQAGSVGCANSDARS
jgi:hypothetical protein